ncbi:MFS transporter [Thioclava sp. FR2]|uniref:MFS transporter n=1 Tax=Thioclava sp. FR2 TaxID=3445780 RepID=UPI003EB81E11
MTAILTAVIALWMFLFSFVALVSLDRAVSPEIQQRTLLIGNVVRDNLQQTLSVGIPIDMLGGIEAYLEEIIDEFAEIRRITVISSKGAVVADFQRAEKPAILDQLEVGKWLGISSSELNLPVLAGNEVVGHIRLVTSAQFVETRLRSVLLDASVLTMAVVLIGVEFALVVASALIWRPLRSVVAVAREQERGSFVHVLTPSGLPIFRFLALRLNGQAQHVADRIKASGVGVSAFPRLISILDLADMRLALFAFAAATEVTASFLPVYARGATRPDWLDPGVAAAAPSAVYLAVLSILAPFVSRLVLRFGPRKVFIFASIPAALALLGMAAADSVASVIFCRGVIAFCYAFATIACQDYALALRAGQDGAKTSAIIMAMVFGGTFCGATIGGIFADRYGYEAAIMLGAALALFAGLAGYRGLRSADARPFRPDAAAPSAAVPSPMMFYGFLFGIVVPMNLVTAVGIWYLAPLRLAALDASPAETARVIMLFYLCQLLLGPVAVRMAESRFGLKMTMILGAFVAGTSLTLFGGETFWLMTATVAGVGAGFALLRGPALEFAAQQSTNAPGRMAVYRVAERAVALAGLLTAAAALGSDASGHIIDALSLIVFLGLLIFSSASAISHWKRRHKK